MDYFYIKLVYRWLYVCFVHCIILVLYIVLFTFASALKTEDFFML